MPGREGEFQLLREYRLRLLRGRLWELPSLVVLTEVSSVLGIPLLRSFYRGGTIEVFDAVAAWAERFHVFTVLVLLSSLFLDPRSLKHFLTGVVAAALCLQCFTA